MDLKRFVVSRAAAWALLGLLVGGFAMDAVWRYQGDDTKQRLEQSENRIADQDAQVERLSAKLVRAETDVNALRSELQAERDMRQRLQDVVSRGRK
ncbi:MAG: hypothetical protein HYR51_04955 [Candidatus Rokubacteria bacterium]|nr:hypothetical protein [Candidatus Rokubacteria bacterium]